MSRFVKITAAVIGALAVLLVAALLIVQTQWFQNYIKGKVIAAVEDSTGGRVEIGSFRFDLWGLRVRITDFSLHGNEASREAPLAHVASLELRLKLFSGLKHAIDLAYLGILDPHVNLIVNPDGTTNIPGPKVKQQASQTSGLDTVVDLAIHEFQIENGSLHLLQKTSQFSAAGKDLNVSLNFNSFNSTYTGRVLINPLVVSTGSGAPLSVQVSLPVLLERDAVSISGGRLTSPQSQVLINAGLRDLNSPKITARINANVALSELGFNDAKQHLTADVAAGYDDKTGEIDIQTAHTVLGQSRFDASGAMAANGNQSVQFNGKLALDELSRLSKTGVPTPLGWLQLHGHMKMETSKNYVVDADLNALGGSAAVKVLVENLRKVKMDAHLSNFGINQMGYAGVLGGVIDAQADLKEKGTAGVAAQTHLTLSPGMRGVPVTGQINGQFFGANKTLRLEQSFLALPHSRLDISGDINQKLNASLISHDLADFAPITGSLPVAFEGGTARLDAQVQGDLSAPKINAHATIDRFAVRGNSFQQLRADFTASPANLTLSNGVLNGSGLHSNFDASLALRKWKPVPTSAVTANVVANGQVAGMVTTVSGLVNAEVHVNGTYGDPIGMANLQLVDGAAYGQTFQKVQGHVDLAHELITLSGFEADAAAGQLLAHGSFRHPGDSFQVGQLEFHLNGANIQLANVQPLAKQSPGIGGTVKLVADGAGNLRSGGTFQPENVSASVSALGLKVNNQAAGDFSAQAQTSNGQVNYNVHSNFAGSAIQIDGSTSLTQEYVTRATASINNLPLDHALAMAGQGALPLKGLVSLNGNVSGTVAHPEASFKLVLAKAMAYSEPLNQLSADIRYTPTLIDVSNFNLNAPAGTLSATAHFAHKDGDFKDGQLELHLNSGEIDLARIKESQVSGGLKLDADIAGDWKEKKLLLSNANVDLNANSLRANGRDLGEVHATARTQQHIVHYQLDSNLGHSDLKASGQTELASSYMTHAKLIFGKVSWANIAPEKPTFDVHTEGEANIDGPILDLDSLTGSLRLNQLAFDAGSRNRPVHLKTDAPAILSLRHSVIQVRHLKIQDAKSNLEAVGSLNLRNIHTGLGLNLKGSADLGLLQSADHDFYSSGTALVDATLHGSLTKPLVNGRLELKNANVNYVSASNGLSNGNGVILLNGTNATIQNLTGESGGGKITLTGFAGLTPTDAAFNVRATARKVRTRYADAAITSNADISLAGNVHRSTLNGTVTIQRIAYSSSSDVGSFLSIASAPPLTASAPSPFLSGMRLDLKVVTAADMRVVSSYAQKLSLTSNLTVSGTAQDPGVVGRVTVTNGELVFFGNTYAVNSGAINFYNVNAIDPILDLSLETISQGVDVTLGVRGPINNLKLSYRSDPPLSFEQIVQLLATNTTPSDPSIAAHQPTPTQQSSSQMGESAVLGQAVANPLASRVQRVFGLSQFKIDPSFSGGNGQPSARVTLQQKITSNLTFTYITDVTQTNSEIVKVTLDITPKVSAVALRDYNGNVSVELFYKFQKR